MDREDAVRWSEGKAGRASGDVNGAEEERTMSGERQGRETEWGRGSEDERRREERRQ